MSRAIVVAGASGIGLGIAQALHGEGYAVTIADLNLEAAQSAADSLGGSATAIAMDVTDEDSVAAGFADLDGLTTVVSCAGTTVPGAITELELAHWKLTTDISLTGTFLVLKHAGKKLVDGGSITAISSLNARQPGRGMGAYCAAKAGATMLAEVAALELAERQIRVNSIQPGRVETPSTAGSAMIPGLVEEFLENTPLGRAGQPEEIANLAVFLASDKAAWITGSTFDINGGAHLQRYPDMLGKLNSFMQAASA